MEEAKETIEREAMQWDIDNPATNEEDLDLTKGGADPPQAKEEEAQAIDTVGAATNREQLSTPKISDDTNMSDVIASKEEVQEMELPAGSSEAVKDLGDNGEEVVEGEEDTVIY